MLLSLPLMIIIMLFGTHNAFYDRYSIQLTLNACTHIYTSFHSVVKLFLDQICVQYFLTFTSTANANVYFFSCFFFLAFPPFPCVCHVYERYYPKQQNIVCMIIIIIVIIAQKLHSKWAQNNIVVNFSIYDLWKYVSTFMMPSNVFALSFLYISFPNTNTRHIT